jgi:vacuolar-type H+-ATPase subunit I/STV1
MINTQPPAGSPAWEHIRLRYEQAQESVEQIAASIGIAGITLSRKAKAEGWLMRMKAKAKAKTKKAAPIKIQNTRETIRRLKELLQGRLAQLEEQISTIGQDINALANERDIRATNTLVRTLEKVLELEHKDRKQRQLRARATTKLNNAEREELARRIANLEPEENGQTSEPDGEQQNSQGAERGLAQLGQA